MKKILTLACLVFTGYISLAQNAPQFFIVDISTKEAQNNTAKSAVNYILSTPADTTVKMRRDAEQYLMIWMEKTDDYAFSIDASISNLLTENKSEAFVLFAAMANYMFKDKSRSDEQIKVAAIKQLIIYSELPANHLSAGPELQKMTKAEKKGKLNDYLKKHE